MITAPSLHNAFKWISIACITFVFITLISIIDLLISPNQYNSFKKLNPDSINLNSTSILNFNSSQIDDSPSNAINPHPFSYLLFEPEICSNFDRSNRLNLITVVHSAPQHFKSRAFIRQTWADRNLYPENRVLFILGLDNNTHTQKLLIEESRQYRDLIQEDFHDTYHNLTYKAVAWLKYVAHYCPNVDFILKVDDDMVINMRHILKFLKFHLVAHDHHTIYCLIWYNLTVQREPTNRWHLSKEDYDNDYFPNYCSGSAYILTTDIIRPLYQHSFRVPFFWIDDIYITGLLIKNYNDQETDDLKKIKHYDLSARYILSKKLLGDQFLQNFAMFAHVPGSVNSRHWFWDEMHKIKLISTPRYAYIADAAMRIKV